MNRNFPYTIVVATSEEGRLARERFGDQCELIVTGVGALNVFHKLESIPRDTPILNFGFAGGFSIPIGETIDVRSVELYHLRADFESPRFELNTIEHGQDTNLGYPCYTSNDFVEQPCVDVPSVYDMELVFILAMGFTNVRSRKVISDNLNVGQYLETTKDVARTTSDEFARQYNTVEKHCRDLLLGKAAEYANDSDRLANFKQPTSMMKTNQAKVCLWYAMKHIASIAKIADDIDGGVLPSDELLLEKVGDYINYGHLFYSNVLEIKKQRA